MKVLIVDDDTDLLDTLSYVLRREGYEVVTAVDGHHALQRQEAAQPDIVLLDGILPKLDGLEVCRQIRLRANTPIVFISARQTEDDRVRALQLGADDYLTKPFGTRELCARMAAVLRRTRDGRELAPNGKIHRVGDLVLNLQSCEAARHNVNIHTTRIEFRILSQLAFEVGQVVSHSRLIEYAWGYEYEGNSTLLKSHISHLRKKLHEHANGDVKIESVVNVGYRLHVAGAPVSQPGRNLLATSIQPGAA